MSQKYKTRHGIDYWPVEMTDLNIDLMYGKKWRQFKERGHEIRDPWIPYLDALKTLYGDAFKVSPWTEDHVRHWIMNERPIYWGSASCGKGFLLSEPVITPTGPRPIGELAVGDLVTTANGSPARVKAVYDHVDLPLYRVRFSDGSSVVCDENHLWTVSYLGRKRWEGPRNDRRAVAGRITRTMDVKRLASWLPGSLRRRHVTVPLTKPVAMIGPPLPLDPYVLGCLLGDGSITGTVTLTSHIGDAEVRDRFSKGLPDGYVLKRIGSSRYGYMVVKSDRSKTENLVVSALKYLELYGNTSSTKFIPEEYLYGSVRDRMDLLAGLLDTDGSVDKSGRIVFSSASRRLAEGVEFLLGSFGARTVTRVKKSPKFQGGTGHPAYVVSAHGLPVSMSRKMFYLTRKRDRLREATRGVGVRYVEAVVRIADRDRYPRETRCITIEERDTDGRKTNGLFLVNDFIVTHNSNDVAACLVPDWIIDPYSTITLVGSTTKDALRIRVWEAIERYFATAKQYGKQHGFLVPGKITQTGYAILNDRQEDDDPNAQGGKAGIHGVALNEGGKLQGAHLPYVRIVIDELATIANHQAVIDTVSNLLVTEDFKFAAMANPEPWSNPSSSIYCTPVGGIDSVSVDSREWDTTFGAKVLHDDGMKSPCVVNPELAPKFPFLTQKKHLDEALKVAGGNPDAPSYWKMARGFPTPVATGAPAVLDVAIAVNMKVQDPGPAFIPTDLYSVAAGIDPAWTAGGDNACYARCWVRRDSFGKMYLDFTNGLRKLMINALDKARPPVQQLREQVLAIMRSNPYEAPFENTAVDTSGNQGLADDLLIYAGANCLGVSFSTRASDTPMRANTSDPRLIKEYIYDRGTEAWCVLAEFCKAGMVRGLPAAAVRALTTRRFAMKTDRKTGIVLGQCMPMRLEDKATFAKVVGHDGSAGGGFRASPDECDACALAALAVKERIGLMPFGYLVDRVAPNQTSPFMPQQTVGSFVRPVGPADFSTEFDGGDMDWNDPL